MLNKLHHKFDFNSKSLRVSLPTVLLYYVISPDQMGGSSSTEEATPAPAASADTNTAIGDYSSSFHIIEVHLPSVGLGTGVLLILGLAYLGHSMHICVLLPLAVDHVTQQEGGGKEREQ